MSNMFAYSKFNGDISKWNVAKVADMSSMFCGSKFGGDIGNWKVGP
jgi:surface protein